MNCTSVSSVSLQSLDRNNLQIDLLKIKNFIFVFLRGILAIAWSMADPELLLLITLLYSEISKYLFQGFSVLETSITKET